MQAELIVSEMIATQEMMNLVGDKRALARLPHNTHMPALVYNIVNDVPDPMVNYKSNTLHKARIQFDPLAHTIQEVKQIQEAIHNAMNFKQNIAVGEAFVVWSRLDLIGSMDKDDETNVWTQSVDYILQYYPKI